MASAYGEPFLLNEQSKNNLAPHTFYLVDNDHLNGEEVEKRIENIMWSKGKF